MLYNFIGDIHGRTNWKPLIKKDAVNIFLGDYFSPYNKSNDLDNYIGYNQCKRNFLEIIKLKKENPNNTVLLLGNHDVDHWCLHERGISRFDAEHYQQIHDLFEKYKDYFTIAYNVNDDLLVTHAGVSAQWYFNQKYPNNHMLHVIWMDSELINKDICIWDAYREYTEKTVTDDFTLPYPLETYSEKDLEYFDRCKKDMQERKRKLLDKPNKSDVYVLNGHFYYYSIEDEDFIEQIVNIPTIVNDINNDFWINRKAEFRFDRNAPSWDYCGESEMHGPLWIRPESLGYSNILGCYPGKYQIVGHTQFHTIYINDEHHILHGIAFCDCLEYDTASLLYDSETKEFTIQKN